MGADSRSSQAKRIYEAERETIEAQYWESRDQARQRLLGALEERKRKLREEKDGGEAVSGAFHLPASWYAHSTPS